MTDVVDLAHALIAATFAHRIRRSRGRARRFVARGARLVRDTSGALVRSREHLGIARPGRRHPFDASGYRSSLHRLHPRSGTRLAGRGACDAKGIAAAMMVAAQTLAEEDEQRVDLLFVVGEEKSSDGARAANLLPATSRFLVNGEPTEGRLASGAKGSMARDGAHARTRRPLGLSGAGRVGDHADARAALHARGARASRRIRCSGAPRSTSAR